MLEVRHESCNRELHLRDYTLACLPSHRADPCMPFTCPVIEHHLYALTERVEAPKSVIAVAAATLLRTPFLDFRLCWLWTKLYIHIHQAHAIVWPPGKSVPPAAPELVVFWVFPSRFAKAENLRWLASNRATPSGNAQEAASSTFYFVLTETYLTLSLLDPSFPSAWSDMPSTP